MVLAGVEYNAHCGMTLVGRALIQRRSKTPKNKDSSNAWSCRGRSAGSKKVVSIGRLDVRVKRDCWSIELDEVRGMKGKSISRRMEYSVQLHLMSRCIPPSSMSSKDAPGAMTREISFRRWSQRWVLIRRPRLTSNRKSH